MTRKQDTGLFSSALSSLWKSFTGGRSPGSTRGASRARPLRIEPCEQRNLLSLISGMVYDDLTGDGFSSDDVPMAGVLVDLYQDDGNGQFDEQTPLQTGTTGLGGDYHFDGLGNGTYFVQQRDGRDQSAGPDFYTVEIDNDDGGMLIDDFAAREVVELYIVLGTAADPTFTQVWDPRIIGGAAEGERDVLLDVIGTPNIASATLVIGQGALNFGSSSPGSALTLQYDGRDVDKDPNDPGKLNNGQFGTPIDLTGGGRNDRFRLNFTSAALVDLTIEAESSNGTALFSKDLLGNELSVAVPFDDPGWNKSPGFSFDEIVRLDFVFNPNGDITIDYNLQSIIVDDAVPASYNFANSDALPSVSGRSFNDANRNGTFDAGTETGVAGVPIELLVDSNANGKFDAAGDAVIATQPTAADGTYSFTNLIDGRYFLREQPGSMPADQQRTSAPEVYTFDIIGGRSVGLLIDDFDVPKVPGVNDGIYRITGLGSPDPTIDQHGDELILGSQRDIRIDVLDPPDPQLDSVTVVITGGLLAFGTSGGDDDAGSNLTLQYDGDDVEPDGVDPTKLNDGAFDAPVDLTVGGTNTGLRLDFQKVQGGAGGGASDLPLDLRIVATSSDGTAEFVGTVLPGQPATKFVPFSDFTPITTGVGADFFENLTRLDFIFNQNGLKRVDFELMAMLAENPDGDRFNFGRAPDQPGAISGYVYVDVDNDGIKDTLETPIPDVVVALKGQVNVNGQWKDAFTALPVLTDANGYYEFTDLPLLDPLGRGPVYYTVEETQPQAFTDGKDKLGVLAEQSGAHAHDDEFNGILLAAQQGTPNLHFRDNNFGERGVAPPYNGKQWLIYPFQDDIGDWRDWGDWPVPTNNAVGRTQGGELLAAEGDYTGSFIDFDGQTLYSHGGSAQDKTGTAEVEDGGVTLHLQGNRWKAIDLDYNVTADTILEFDFFSGSQGEIHAIGLDSDLELSKDRTFQLYGTQDWGIGDFNDYDDTAPGVKHYKINVGQHYTGQMNYMFFANDHDASDPNGEGLFSSIRLYELEPEGEGLQSESAAAPAGRQPALDFGAFSIDSYAGAAQNKAGSVAVEDGGATLHVQGNLWKSIGLNYDVTRNTVLEFDFRSTSEGEIHAIGFDNDAELSKDRTFQLFGTQNWGNGDFNDYDAATGSRHYQIAVGQYYTGQMDRLFFANDHDVSDPDGEGIFSNVRVYEAEAQPVLDVGGYAIDSYGGSAQDRAGTAAVEDGGATLHLQGNKWKAVELNYNIAADTVLEFDFKSNGQGEIHGIGLDTDLELSKDRLFQLYGTQTWGIGDFNDYAGGAPGAEHYRIPVGQFYTGGANYLFFANDHDVSNPTGESLFSNIRLYEPGSASAPAGYATTRAADSLFGNVQVLLMADHFSQSSTFGSSSSSSSRASNTVTDLLMSDLGR